MRHLWTTFQTVLEHIELIVLLHYVHSLFLRLSIKIGLQIDKKNVTNMIFVKRELLWIIFI